MIEIAVARILGKPDNPSPQWVNVLSRDCTHRENLCAAITEKTSLKEFLYLKLHLRCPAGADRIDLGDHRKARANAEQAADGEVLHGLRLYTFLGGDNQHHSSDASGPGEHVVNKQAVARHINEADSEWTSRGRGSIEEGEAEIDGYTAPLLFRQSIRIDTSKSTNQCSLAVIDMTRGADNHGLDRLRHAKGCITGGRPFPQ